MEKYYKRVTDSLFDLKMKAFGAVNIVGPKWCGKTKTATQKAKSAIYLQYETQNEDFVKRANNDAEFILEGIKPRLIDEWQDVSKVWDLVRFYCDKNGGQGNFILTGSTSKKVKTSHTGTGRITDLRMYPMSLYESLESNGTVSLKKLFDGEENLEKGCNSNLSLEDLIFAACRGGWPQSVIVEDREAKLAIAKDYFEQIYTRDIYNVDEVKRNSQTMRAVLRSYARNISTLAKRVSILEDVNSTNSITDKTLDDYIEVLERLYIVDDLYGWSPNIRSKSAIRSGRKREFVDPSIAVAALNGSPEKYINDLHTFGFIFETMCIRDLKVYSNALRSNVSYYHDNLGLEADAVLHLDDGRYALIEFKLGNDEIEKGAKNLNKLESLIIKQNENSKVKIDLPTLKIIITGTKYGYKREDNVYVIPLGCLKD